MAADQKNRGLLKRDSDSHFVESSLDTTGETLLFDISVDKALPIVPDSLRNQVFDSIHTLFYPGVRASIKLIAIAILGQV